MFSALGALLDGIWSALKAIIQGTWTIVQTGWTWAVGLIVVVVGCVTQVVNAFASLLESVVSSVSSLGTPSHTPDFAAVGTFLNVANHFFPVQEGFALLVLLSVTWLIMLSYRLVKSWIPTLA